MITIEEIETEFQHWLFQMFMPLFFRKYGDALPAPATNNPIGVENVNIY